MSKKRLNKHTGQRKKILFRMRALTEDMAELPSPLHFFGIGYQSVDYRYVLADNVTLYTIFDDMAVFVETPNHIYDTNTDPFFEESQFHKASHVILMPLDTAIQLSDEIGDPQQRVFCLSHPSRAGSTLVAQMLKKTGCILTISMPDAFRCLFITLQDQPYKTKQRLIKMIMRLICKPVTIYEETEAIFIKLKSVDIAIVPLLVETLPWIHHIFLYRGGMKCLQSIQKIWAATDWNTFIKIQPIKNLFIKLFRYHAPLIGNSNMINSLPTELLAWFYLSNCAKLLRLRTKYSIPIFAYEDLIDNTEKVLSKMFELIGISQSMIPAAKSAMVHHSQQNSVMLQSDMNRGTVPYEGEYKHQVDKISEALGIPKLDELLDM